MDTVGQLSVSKIVKLLILVQLHSSTVPLKLRHCGALQMFY